MKAKTLSKKKAVPATKKKAVSTVKKKASPRVKGKAVTAPKKKPVAPSKTKAVSSSKKKAVSPAKKKPALSAKKKLELNNQVEDFFKGKRIAYFVLDTERTKEGAFILCVAVEGESGFYKMDWAWHCSYTKAKAETVLLNDKLGLAEEEVNEIIISTMG